MFDETFIHYAENRSGQNRLILFCDIERPMKTRWAQRLNHWLGKNVVAAGASPNDAGDKTGFINRIFIVSHVLGQYRRRFKRWNPTVYRATRVLLLVGRGRGVRVPCSTWRVRCGRRVPDRSGRMRTRCADGSRSPPR